MGNRKYFIYKYTFPNGKVYIGQTYTGSYRYGNPKKYIGTLVGNAFNKYPNYKKEIIEYCSKEEVDDKERYYINIYKSNDRKYGYNRDSGGNESKELTPELKSELSNAHLGLQVSKIEQYDLNGSFLKEWNSIKEAAEKLGIDRSSISHALHGDQAVAGGYIWKLKEKYSPLKYKEIEQYDLNGNYLRTWRNCQEAEETLALKSIHLALNGSNKTCGGFQWKYKDSNKIVGPYRTKRTYESRPIYQYDINGTFLKEWKSYYEASHALKIPHQHINRVLTGKRKMTRGYIFSYEKHDIINPYNPDDKSFYKPVVQMDMDGKEIKEWKSITEAQKALSITSGIGKCCVGKAKSAGGYRWKFRE